MSFSSRPTFPEPQMRLNYAILFVSDMPRSVAFYRDVVGLPLKFESVGWSEFATEGATLALHLSEGPPTAKENPHQVPPARCRPGFSVPNLDVFHQRMLVHAVPCIQDPEMLFGARLAQYEDPDGLAFSVGEERTES